MSRPAQTLLQWLRYGVVGVVTNALLFSGYRLSAFGVGAKTAMSLLYVPGVLLGFLGNRTFTFGHEGRVPTSMARYLAVCAFGYVINFTSLVVFVDRLRLPTDVVVLTLIIVTAGMLFALQRSWVFPPEPRVTPPSDPTSPR